MKMRKTVILDVPVVNASLHPGRTFDEYCQDLLTEQLEFRSMMAQSNSDETTHRRLEEDAEVVFKAIEQATNRTRDEIRSKDRHRHIVIARNIASLMLRMRGYTLHQIAYIINKDHASVLYGVKSAKNDYNMNYDKFVGLFDRIAYLTGFFHNKTT